MASNSRGQPLAWQTKVVHQYLGALKAGSKPFLVSGGDNDTVSSKPITGRDMVDATILNLSCCVSKCGSKKCKTCDHIIEGDNFVSNITNKRYKVVSPNGCMSCGTKNVIYLMACRKCGVQYVGETSQTLRRRFNNHRNRMKQLSDLYLYHHFCSDGHGAEDVSIMPIEEVVLTPGDNMSLASKILQREEYWYKELCTIYPYGLNDNVRGLGNVSRKMGQGIVIYTLFNRQTHKYRKRTKKKRKKPKHDEIGQQVTNLLRMYRSRGFSFELRTYVLSLPRKSLLTVMHAIETLQNDSSIPRRVALMVKDLITHRNRVHIPIVHDEISEKCPSNYLKLFFHNKGVEMLNLPRILHSKRVSRSVPTFLSTTDPPTVSYSYSNTISGKVFNFRKAIKHLDFSVGTNDMSCNCSTSPYNYAPLGHIVTGNLKIIKNRKLRQLLLKGPSYREQNNINWEVNVKLCKEAVKKYKERWARKENVDTRVLTDWEHTVNSLIDKRVELLKKNILLGVQSKSLGIRSVLIF